MKLKTFLNETENVKHENKLLKFVIVVLAIAVIFSFYYTSKTLKQEKIILLPPQVNSKIVFFGNKPNKAYFDQITRYIISLALDYTSATAKGQFAELLTMFSPGAFKSYQQAFYNLADRVQSASNISNSFYIDNIKVYSDKKKIIVAGSEDMYSSTELLTREQRKYEIGYEIKNERFFITSFKMLKEGQ